MSDRGPQVQRHHTQVQGRSKRGNYTMMMGAMTVLVLGFAAFSIDMSLIALAEIETQAAANSASHAALVAFRESRDYSVALEAAGAMLDENPIIGQPGTFASGYPKLGTWNTDQGTFTARAASQASQVNSAQASVERAGSNAINLILAPVAFGREKHSTDGFATTSMRMREIMLVQDASCSMMNFYAYNQGSGPGPSEDPSVPEVAADQYPMPLARGASMAFLDYMIDNPSAGDKIGLSFFSASTTTAPWVPLTEITAGNLSDIRAGINGICSTEGDTSSLDYSQQGSGSDVKYCFDTGERRPVHPSFSSSTNQKAGIEQATSELLSAGSDVAYRAIVLMSDGKPTAGGGGGVSSKQAATNAANAAKDQDIAVWSVVFNNGGYVDVDFMKSLATSEEMGFDTPNANELEGIMLEIARSISLVMVE